MDLNSDLAIEKSLFQGMLMVGDFFHHSTLLHSPKTMPTLLT